MILDTHVDYTVAYRPKRAQRHTLRTGRVRESVALMVREVDENAALLVARIGRYGYSPRNGHPPVEFRHFEGRFWQQHVVDEDGCPTHFTASMLATRAASHEDAAGSGTYWATGKAPEPLADVAEIRENGRDKAIAAAEAEAADTIIVNGHVFRTTREPVLRITPHGYGRTDMALYSASVVSLPYDEDTLKECHRLDSAAFQIEERDAEHDGAHDLGQTLDKLGIELIRPELLEFDELPVSLRRTATTYLNRMGSILASSSRERMMAFADLRDILDNGSATDHDVAEAAAKVVALAPADKEYADKDMEAAIALWHRASEYRERQAAMFASFDP